MLVLLTVLACLDTIATCIGKEASDLYILWNAKQDTWLYSTSARFVTANRALTTCLQLLNLPATGGNMLPSMLLYHYLDQKQKCDNDKILAATK